MSFHVPNEERVLYGNDGTDDSAGNNGVFHITIADKRFFQNLLFKPRVLSCKAEDLEEWEHVSIAVMNKPVQPSCEQMRLIKNLFWENTDMVIQYYEPDDKPGMPLAVHLWRPKTTQLPVPDCYK